MSSKSARETEYMLNTLQRAGISRADAEALRRISMTLHRWHEMECGVEGGGLDQDEATGKWWWYNSRLGKRTHVVTDRETGARKRLAAIMARYPDLRAYIQGDPRGAALYILRNDDVPGGAKHAVDQNLPIVDSCYSRGLAVYK